MGIIRQSIVVPRSDAAGERIYSFADAPDDYIVVTLEPDIFSLLWSHGLFERINRGLAMCISDYEEDEVAPDRVGDLQIIVRDFRRRRAFGERATAFLDRFEAAMTQAVALKQPVWFIL